MACFEDFVFITSAWIFHSWAHLAVCTSSIAASHIYTRTLALRSGMKCEARRMEGKCKLTSGSCKRAHRTSAFIRPSLFLRSGISDDSSVNLLSTSARFYIHRVIVRALDLSLISPALFSIAWSDFKVFNGQTKNKNVRHTEGIGETAAFHPVSLASVF